MARELARLDIDIAALSEVRFAEQGSFREDGAGYTLFWSGKNKAPSGKTERATPSSGLGRRRLPEGKTEQAISSSALGRTRTSAVTLVSAS